MQFSFGMSLEGGSSSWLSSDYLGRYSWESPSTAIFMSGWPILTFETIASPTARRRACVGAGLLLLSIPVCISLFTSALPDGHDAFEYFPRMVEFHQNISSGVLFPKWAPDLSRGTGQPLFLFNPPMIYYAGELWHILGFDFITALNLACVVLVLASALGMFLLGRLHFGDGGGWLAAAAYLYAPYFSVNLYVRSDLAEFAAFPFFAFAMYGFGAYAKRPERVGYLLLGAASYAGVLLSHNASALFFTPLLLAYICVTAWVAGSWSVLSRQALAWLAGLGLGAFIWIPALVERDSVHLDRLLQGYLNYSNHFVYLHQLFYSPWGYGISVAGDQDGMSFAVGWSHLLLALIAGIWTARKPVAGDRRWLRFFGHQCSGLLHSHASGRGMVLGPCATTAIRRVSMAIACACGGLHCAGRGGAGTIIELNAAPASDRLCGSHGTIDRAQSCSYAAEAV